MKTVAIPISAIFDSRNNITQFQKTDPVNVCTAIMKNLPVSKTRNWVSIIYCDVIELVWSGDLDQDGIMDFMLSYATENAFGYQLFLSSAAHGKQLVKPLKIYWYGDCC